MDPIALYRLECELTNWRREQQTPILWWRDDDAREPTEALTRLLEAASGAPLSLAVIPDVDLAPLAERLIGVSGVTISQHGVHHANKRGPGEPRSEYPASASLEDKTQAILDGHKRMRAAGLAPAFYTPPWNDFDDELLAAVKGADHVAFSAGIHGRAMGGLLHVGAQVDILRWKREPRFRSTGRIFNALRKQLELRRAAKRFDDPVGLLTHHLVHDEKAWQFLDWFLPYARVRFRWRSFPQILEAQVKALLAVAGPAPNRIVRPGIEMDPPAIGPGIMPDIAPQIKPPSRAAGSARPQSRVRPAQRKARGRWPTPN